MIRAAVAAVAIALAAPAHAAPATAGIGDLVLEYDDDAWQIDVWTDGARIRPRACQAIRCGDGTGIAVRITPADGPLPTEIPRSEHGFVDPLWELADDIPAWPGNGTVREINGLTVVALDRWSGCRAMSPSELTAIIDHHGRRYTLTSGIAAGCAGVWGVGREAFVEIISGLRPRP